MTDGNVTKDKTLKEIETLLEEYMKQYHEPLAFKAISQKWNKIARSAGFSLIEALKSDDRFLVDLDRSAAYRVALRAKSQLSEIVCHILRKNGQEMPLQRLKQELVLATGLDVSEIKDKIEFLIGTKMISLHDFGPETMVCLDVDPAAKF